MCIANGHMYRFACVYTYVCKYTYRNPDQLCFGFSGGASAEIPSSLKVVSASDYCFTV